MNIARLIILFFALAAGAYSQIVAVPTADHDDTQSWNDLQLTVPVSKHFDLVAKLTLRFGRNVTDLSDERQQVGFAWKPTKSLTITPFYSFIQTRAVPGPYRRENRLSLAGAYRFPIKRFGLTHRSTYEKRLRFPRNSWRYRAMIMIDKELPEKLLSHAKFFISDEVFYDSILDRFNRNRFSVGVTKTLSKRLALDVYYLRQNDGFTIPGELHVLGTTWKVKR